MATETMRRFPVAWRALFSAMSMASPPPLPYITLVRVGPFGPGGALVTSASARAVRARLGKWWLPMSKRCMAAVTAATTSELRWPRL